MQNNEQWVLQHVVVQGQSVLQFYNMQDNPNLGNILVNQPQDAAQQIMANQHIIQNNNQNYRAEPQDENARGR